jgi:hypothetical protein
MQLDHGKREIHAIGFGFLRNCFVQFEAWHILRCVLRNQPAIIVDGNEDADIHCGAAPFCKSRMVRLFCCFGKAMGVPSTWPVCLPSDEPLHS